MYRNQPLENDGGNLASFLGSSLVVHVYINSLSTEHSKKTRVTDPFRCSPFPLSFKMLYKNRTNLTPV